MAKASVYEQLDAAVQAAVTRLSDAKAAPRGGADARVVPLIRVAAELRDLPREEFKIRLRKELERSASMATTVEPIAAVRATASPRMTYKDAAKAIEFYKQAFGAKEIMRFEVGGGIPHAEIMIGDSAIMLTEEWPEGGRYSAETLGNSPVLISLNVPNADAFVAHAVSAGAKVKLPVTDQFYGRREGTLVDPFGYVWSVSTVTEDMSAEEMHRRFDAMMKPQEAKKPVVDPVPPGYRTLTTYLVARDADGLIDFVKKTFGAEEKFRSVGVGGRTACRGADWRFHADDWWRDSGWGMEGRAAAQCVPRVCAGLRCGLSACSGGGSDADCRSQRPGIWRTLGECERCSREPVVYRDSYARRLQMGRGAGCAAVSASTAGRAGDQFSEASVRSCGTRPLYGAGRSDASYDHQNRGFVYGDGRSARPVPAHADDVLSLCAELR